MTRRKKIKKSTTTGIVPEKLRGVRNIVHKLVENKKYVPTGHAKKRLDQREVTILEVRAVLASGKRDPSYDEFHDYDDHGNYINRWSYAFSKKGLDREMRVCVSIDDTRDKPLLIVTVPRGCINIAF